MRFVLAPIIVAADFLLLWALWHSIGALLGVVMIVGGVILACWLVARILEAAARNRAL